MLVINARRWATLKLVLRYFIQQKRFEITSLIPFLITDSNKKKNTTLQKYLFYS